MEPFIKWAGGKRWLAREIARQAPREIRTYYEPFLGGGATFFHLRPQTAVLSDSNDELITTYRAVRDAPKVVERLLAEHQAQHDDAYFYEVRSRTPDTPAARAARFLYLNRTCWNGLYRVNLKGEFNVPRGTKNTIIIPGENFAAISSALQEAEILTADFGLTMKRAGAGDLVYVDPPYTVKHNCNGFIKYNDTIFSWEDQVRLRDACVEARCRGATVIVSNADHHSVRELYATADHIDSIARASVIAGNSAARQRTTEMLAVLRGAM